MSAWSKRSTRPRPARGLARGRTAGGRGRSAAQPLVHEEHVAPTVPEPFVAAADLDIPGHDVEVHLGAPFPAEPSLKLEDETAPDAGAARRPSDRQVVDPSSPTIEPAQDDPDQAPPALRDQEEVGVPPPRPFEFRSRVRRREGKPRGSPQADDGGEVARGVGSEAGPDRAAAGRHRTRRTVGERASGNPSQSARPRYGCSAFALRAESSRWTNSFARTIPLNFFANWSSRSPRIPMTILSMPMSV